MLLTKRGGIPTRVISMLMTILLLVPGVAIAQDKQVVDIQIVGNTNVSRDAILTAIAPSLKAGSTYSEKSVADAKTAIANMGYFGEPITVGTENADGGVRVVFTVIENPVVKEIKFTGNTKITSDKLRSAMRTTVGTVLNMNTLVQQDIPAIERVYTDQGYIAFVAEDPSIGDTGVLTIPIGETKIEDIKVTGLKKTNPDVIRRELVLKPGDVFNFKTMTADMTRVYDLDIFERDIPELYKVDPGSEPGKVIVTIGVRERKTGEVSVGVGYSSRNRLTGQAKLSESNFRGRAETVNLLWEQSGEGGSSYEAGFFEPWLDRKHSSLGVNVYNKQIFRFGTAITGTSGSTDYEERRKGGSVTYGRPLGKVSRAFFTLRDEAVDSNLAALDSSTTDGAVQGNSNIASGTLRLTSDTRDSSLDPFLGRYVSYAAELGSAKIDDLAVNNVVTGTTTNGFTKFSIDARQFFSHGGARKEISERRKVLAMRLMGGAITGRVPFAEEYFVGGAETLRGYREDRFWGNTMLLLTTEYRVPVASSLTGVVFADIGDAWGAPRANLFKPNGELIIKGLTQHSNFSPHLGYGLGIRIITPIGPLRLDYGFGSEGSRAHFSIGHVF